MSYTWEWERRRLLGTVRRMLESFERALSEMEELASLMAEWEEEVERLLDSRLKSLATGELEPLYTIYDVGDEYLLVIDLPGAAEDSIEVYVGEDRVAVEAEVRREVAGAVFGGEFYRATARRYRGEIALPEPVEPRGVRVERRGGRLIVRIPKKIG